MLAKRLSRHFSKGVRSRGEVYFLQNRVSILEMDHHSVHAEVSGEDTYTVSLGVDCAGDPWVLDVWCTCPYIDSHDECCKHIWATLLVVENKKPFNSLPRNMDLCLNDVELNVPAASLKPVPRKARQLVAADRTSGRVKPDSLLIEELAAQLGLKVFPAASSRNMYPAKAKATPKPPQVPGWSKLFKELATNSYAQTPPPLRNTTPLEPLYVLQDERLEERGCFTIGLMQQAVKKSGKPGRTRKLSITAADVQRIPDPLDRQICLMLVGAGVSRDTYGYYRSFSGDHRGAQSSWIISDEVRGAVLPLLFQSGRFHLSINGMLEPLTWDDGGRWELYLDLASNSDSKGARLEAGLRRGEARRPLSAIQFLIPGNPALTIADGRMSEIETHDCLSWARTLRDRRPVLVTRLERDGFLSDLAGLGAVPPVAWPSDWNMVDSDSESLKPELQLRLSDHPQSTKQRSYAGAKVLFRYGDRSATPQQKGAVILDPKDRRQIRRDRAKEQQLLDRLHELGMEVDPYSRELCVLESRLPAMLTALLVEGWTVLGNQKLFHVGGELTVDVTTGIDWFDLDGFMDFGGQKVPLPELLAAARKGERFVRLGDGSMGMVPEDWMARHGAVLGLGQTEDGHIRFAKTQIGLIDALLAAMPKATFDRNLKEAREKVRGFTGIQPRRAPSDFAGTLRPYQEHGLAWLGFLNDFRWGGCLADDMGLGKTIQMLALLADRKASGDTGPSLIVVPKSIVFNWMREAQQFAPQLRVLDFTGTSRKDLQAKLDETDIVVTTYGTLKRDIDTLGQRQFNYVVLDEAQAIKNPTSQNAKAVRLLKAHHRVAMTGTPVENHLGDLWSLFEFLNPGMLGTTNAFKGAFGNGKAAGQEPRQLQFLHRMLRPFILRRTKLEVAPELPKRTEQTIECTMTPKQAAYYKELRDYYRASLLGKVDKEGLAKNKIVVLEALLRLRQAACHPGLIDASKMDVEAAKLEALMPMISELVAEGHKALIFSQFVKMLDIVRGKIDEQGIPYEYLDGQTNDRQAHVDHFQKDPKCPLFLISLKAGGVGLNLTAADYVIILDPWWNPAVEAQAIDRTHRIGQDKNIIAYRLVTRDTVEQKILQLQQSKRELADSIITQANSLIQNLTRDDLALLLS